MNTNKTFQGGYAMDNASRIFGPKSFSQVILAITLGILFTLIIFVPTNHAQEAAYIDIAGDIYVTASDPGVTFLNLRVMDPLGEMIFDQSSDGSPIQWVPYDVSLDGYYSYEVRVGYGQRNRVRRDAQEEGERIRPRRQSGTVLILDGAIVPPDEEETSDEEASLLKDICDITKLAFSKFMGFLVTPAYADVVYNDDVIIDGSECVGNDCYSGMDFGFDTIRLTEHNLRIFFDDTSSTSSFPRNDWRIQINDSTDGGGSYFAIQDATEGVVPFTIEAGASANSLYVDDYGRVGLGTSVPYFELHIADGDTPTVRLEQDGSYGWTPQTWDMAGNETNFFIRDATHASRMPFRIQPNTPTSTLCLKSDGNVGIGTFSPDSELDVESNTSPGLRLTNTGAAGGSWDVFMNSNTGRLNLRNNSTSNIPFKLGPGANNNLLRVGVFAADEVLINGELVVTGACSCAPDYVFAPEYELMTLSELETYIAENAHLPKVPNGAELETKGVNVQDFSYVLLEKIEELTLYTLQQERRIEELQARLTVLEGK